MSKPRNFETEVQGYLLLKTHSTVKTYGTGSVKSLEYYKSKYGKDKGFAHFLDRIFEEFKKTAREQRRVGD
jgi:hypothetical protein